MSPPTRHCTNCQLRICRGKPWYCKSPNWLPLPRVCKQTRWRLFFLAQIDIAKIIQYRHHAALQAGLEIQETPDLELVIRPALDALGVAITQLLAQRIAEAGQLTEENWDQFNDTVTAAYLETADKRRLFQSLLSVTAQ